MCHWAGIAILCLTRGVEGEAAPGTEVGRCARGPLPRAPSSHLGFLSPGPATSLLLSQARGGGKLEPLPSRRLQGTPGLWNSAVTAGGGGDDTSGAACSPNPARQVTSGLPHSTGPAAGQPIAIARPPSKPDPGCQPLLHLNRWHLPGCTFEFHDGCWHGPCGPQTRTRHPRAGRREGGRESGAAVDVGTWGGARVEPPPEAPQAPAPAHAPRGWCPPTAPGGAFLAPHGDRRAAATSAGSSPAGPPARGTVRNEGRRRAPPRKAARAASAAPATHTRAAAAAAGRPFKCPGSFAWPRPPVTRLARAGPSPLPLGRSF